MLRKNAAYNRQLWVGIGISAFFLYITFRKIQFSELLAAFASMDCRYIAPAVIVTFLSYYLRAIRWKYLLKPLKNCAMGNLFPATIIGYMANNLLPARLGEFVRAYVLGEKERLDKSAVFATLVLDRLFDGFTVLILLVITLFTMKLPEGMSGAQKSLQYGGYLTLLFYLLVIAFLVVLKLNSLRAIHVLGKVLKPLPERFSGKVLPLLGSFMEGIRFSSKATDIAALFLSSLAMWALAVWTVDLSLLAFHITLPLTAAMFILILLVFAVMVPASPGYVGTYHAACVYGLLAYGLPKEMALSIALTVHALNFFPVTFLGLYYLVRDRISLKAVNAESLSQGQAVGRE